MKLVAALNGASRTVKVYYDSDLAEYVAKLYVDGKHYEPADYFTDDKGDALGTASAMLNPTKETA